MTTTLKKTSQAIVASNINPTRAFFRISEVIPSIAHAQDIFKVFRSYGELVEYKFLRCPETLVYLRYGFIVYKNSQDANKIIQQQFIKHHSDLFEKPIEIKVERSTNKQ